MEYKIAIIIENRSVGYLNRQTGASGEANSTDKRLQKGGVQ